MDYHVTITLQADGSFAARCEEIPEFEVSGATSEECDIAVMRTLMMALPADFSPMNTLYEEFRLMVRYQGLPPEEALRHNWELFLPRHVHGVE